MHPSILLSATWVVFSSPLLFLTTPVLAAGVAPAGAGGNGEFVSVISAMTRTATERLSAWNQLGLFLRDVDVSEPNQKFGGPVAAAAAAQPGNNVPTVVIGPGNKVQPLPAARQAAPMPVEQKQPDPAAPKQAQMLNDSPAPVAFKVPAVEVAKGNNKPPEQGAKQAADKSDDDEPEDVDIDEDSIKGPAPAEAKRPPRDDKVGGVGGEGSGEKASEAEVKSFFDAQSGDELVGIMRKLHAGFSGTENPEQERPLYVSHETAAAAYFAWTGLKEVDPCKGDIVKEVVFATPPTCMKEKITADNMPMHVGLRRLRRRGCIFTNVRCIEKKAMMITPDALKRQVTEQFLDRKGDYWYSGRTFAKQDTVNELYRQLYPGLPKGGAGANVCSNSGLEEFGSEYGVGAVLAIFAESEACLTAARNDQGKACRRVAVDCIGNWSKNPKG